MRPTKPKNAVSLNLSKLLLVSAAMLALSPDIARASGTDCVTQEQPTPALKQLRRMFIDSSVNALTFHSIDSIFNTVPVQAGKSRSTLASEPRALDFKYNFEGQFRPAVDVLERTFTNALLILKDGKIVYETYRNFTSAQTKFLSMSTAKSITSILVGAALQDKKIKAITDKVTVYVPELKGTAFEDATIQDLLLMKSGADREDNYQPDPDSELAKLREEVMVMNCRRSVDEAFLTKKKEMPGRVFRYSTLNTNLLGWALERATGRPLNEYMSERLWKPLGAESDGYFLTDGPAPLGRATNGMGFNAVARDYARLGQMMLNEGKVGGKRIIPADWVRASTIPTGPEPADQNQDQGYQYQWWTLVNSNAYMAIGLQGQFIFVDPDTKTVIVKLSYFPIQDRNAYKESEAFFRAASLWSVDGK